MFPPDAFRVLFIIEQKGRPCKPVVGKSAPRRFQVWPVLNYGVEPVRFLRRLDSATWVVLMATVTQRAVRRRRVCFRHGIE
jgi:hypothetical protein